MYKIKTETKLCLICMEEHEVQTVITEDTEEFKDQLIYFDAKYEYCPQADEYLETEEMIKSNSLAMKDAYREKAGLLTSKEIIEIRDRYEVSQKDFSEILDWGRATITRYENHQVQDRAHDDILRKIASDPKWFMQMLKRTRGRISEKAFNRSYKAAIKQYEKTKHNYLVDGMKVVKALYAKDDEVFSVQDHSTKRTAKKIIELKPTSDVSIINKSEDHQDNKWHKVETIKLSQRYFNSTNIKENVSKYEFNEIVPQKLKE